MQKRFHVLFLSLYIVWVCMSRPKRLSAYDVHTRYVVFCHSDGIPFYCHYTYQKPLYETRKFYIFAHIFYYYYCMCSLSLSASIFGCICYIYININQCAPSKPRMNNEFLVWCACILFFFHVSFIFFIHFILYSIKKWFFILSSQWDENHWNFEQ